MTASSNESNWSLHDEFAKLTGNSNPGEALAALGIISSSVADFRIDQNDARWVRGGVETYIYRFDIRERNAEPKALILKACVAYSPGQDLDEILREWVQRRQLLLSSGVECPALYGWGSGVLLEEFIKFDVQERLSSSSRANERLLEQLAKFAAALSKHGFAPVQPFNDLRSRGTDVVVADFGQDLGPAGVVSTQRPRIFDMLLSFLKNAGHRLSPLSQDQLRATFAANGGELLH